MKELSIEEKARRYDEAIIRGSRLWESDTITRENYEYIFPELKKFEDEEIRGAILHFISHTPTVPKGFISKEDMIAWLEKQGEHKDILEDAILDSNEDGLIAETIREKKKHKPADNVKPKFKVGDIIVNDYCMGRIVEITNDAYLLDTEQGIPFSCHSTRLWDVTKDANDGDVLVASDGSIFIFKEVVNNGCKHYIALATDKVVNVNVGLKHYWETAKCVKPATKEQRDQLEKAMANAGYTFDFDKKELKKIEGTTAWSEEDEEMLDTLIANYKFLSKEFRDKEHNFFVGMSLVKEDLDMIDWLKSIKNRVQPQNTWKPSLAQMNALSIVSKGNAPDDMEAIASLYQDLKKLKG